MTNFVGLIPAAGRATRFFGLPKYLFPLGNNSMLGSLCMRLTDGGAQELYIGANSDNRELLSRYAPYDAKIYRIDSRTMSETVWCAHKYHIIDDENANVLFGMPDSYWTDETVYPRMADAIRAGATVAVALFEAHPGQHKSVGMIDAIFDREDLIVRRVVDKPAETDLHLCWGALAWAPDFWQYIDPADPHVGYAVQRAIEHRVTVHGVLATGGYWDVGTPEGYYECIRAQSEIATGVK